MEALLNNEPYSCAWSSISKFAHNYKRASGIYEQSIATVDNVLLDEVRVLDPSVCLFLTGPDFDTRVINIFKGVKYREVPGHKIRALARLDHPSLPSASFRSYHPNFLRQQKQEDGYLEFIRTNVA